MSIRIAAETDLPQILAIYGPYVENTTISFEYDVPTLEAFRERFLEITKQFPWLVWEEEGQILGYAYACAPFERAAYAWCAEVSVYLAPKAHGRGIGRTLYAVLEHILWQQGYRVIYALITSENTGSLAFHEKVGYRFSAEFPRCGLKFGRWLGVTWLDKELLSVDSPSSFPRSFPEIRQDLQKNFDILGNLSIS